jgi:hypothetical protein
MIKNSTLWIRVELLRGFGARVQVDKKGAEVSWGDKTITGTEVGVKWRDYGWWVPLRRTASALGWQVEWRPGVREVVLRP